MKGKISISKIHDCNSGEEHMQIIIEDESSSVEFLTVEMSLLNLMEALTGLSSIPINFGLRGVNKIGKQLEIKSENICIPYNATDIQIRTLIKKHEINGWMGRFSDAKNFHNLISSAGESDTSTYRISFHRYV